MTAILIGLGSNLGDRQANLDQAVQLLAALPDVGLLAASHSHATNPVGGPTGQREFLNAAAIFETSMEPAPLLAALQRIELSLGRRRGVPRWSPRPIDLDLLLYGSLVVETAELTIPHPRMAFRRFVIEPSAEIAPNMRHASIGWTLAELRDHLRAARRYVAIAGAPYSGKSRLAADASIDVGARWLRDPLAEPAFTRRFGLPHPLSPSGPAGELAIELLDLRCSQLIAAAAEAKSDAGENASELAMRGREVAISDYWLDQAICFAAETLPPERMEEFERQWRAAAARVPRAKLLVLLDAPVDFLWNIASSIEHPAWLNFESFSRLREAIVDRAEAPGRGPLLRLDARSPEASRLELAAAIVAMSG